LYISSLALFSYIAFSFITSISSRRRTLV